MAVDKPPAGCSGEALHQQLSKAAQQQQELVDRGSGLDKTSSWRHQVVVALQFCSLENTNININFLSIEML